MSDYIARLKTAAEKAENDYPFYDETMANSAKAVLKLIRDYDALAAQRDEGLAREAELQQRIARLEQGLKFYAEGHHLLLADADVWDTCSGEPINFLHDDAGTASVEDGSIAKQCLASPGCTGGEKS